jgi:hypothetical protein
VKFSGVANSVSDIISLFHFIPSKSFIFALFVSKFIAAEQSPESEICQSFNDIRDILEMNESVLGFLSADVWTFIHSGHPNIIDSYCSGSAYNHSVQQANTKKTTETGQKRKK